MPNAGRQAGVFVPVLNTAINRYAIVTPKRIAAILAQIGHESAQLTRIIENLNYGAQGLIQITGKHNYRSAVKPLAWT